MGLGGLGWGLSYYITTFGHEYSPKKMDWWCIHDHTVSMNHDVSLSRVWQEGEKDMQGEHR